MPDRWNAAAKVRRSQIESGLDITFNDVFMPMYINFVKRLGPSDVLEVGAGTGHLSRAVYGYMNNLTSLEPSLGMYEIAEEVLAGTPVKLLNCEVGDLSDHCKYDLVFSHLVAHCVEDLKSFLLKIENLLKKGGLFLFSIPHPCFYNDYKNFLGDEYCYAYPLSKSVSFFITKDRNREISGVPYHHRPLSFYLNEIISSGLLIRHFDEVFPSKEIQEKYGEIWLSPRYCTFLCEKP